MKCALGLMLILAGTELSAGRQIEVLPEAQPQCVFGDKAQSVAVRFCGRGEKIVTVDLLPRLLQASATTVAHVRDLPGKRLTLLPGQTVLEVETLDLPAVRAESRFLIEWHNDGSNVIGQTEVLAYPTNLLTRLKGLAGDEPVGVFDPTGVLKLVLRSQTVPFQDLVEAGTDKFPGRLAIFGPFATKAQMRASLRDDIRALAKRGVAVVWLQPPPEKHAPLKPSFYAVREGGGAVVVAEHTLVAQLAERPEAQLNVLRLAEEALHPTPLALPETESSN